MSSGVSHFALAGAGTLSLMATGGTPMPIILRLNTEMRVALKDPEVIKRLADAGEHPSPSTPEELGARMKSEITRWAKVIADAGIEKQ